MSKNIFAENAPTYWAKSLSVVPVPPGTKRGIKDWNHYGHNLPNPKKREEWLKEHANHGIAYLTGTLLEDGTRVAGFDIDDDAYVAPLKRMIGASLSAKKGKKGETIFIRVPKTTKSTKISFKKKGIVDLLVTNKLCVLPPTLHPETGRAYEWIGDPLNEVDLNSLPFLDEGKLLLIKAIIENENHEAIMAGTGTHEPALSLTASLAGKFDDADMVIGFIGALLPENYAKNLRDELREMFLSAKEKGLGQNPALTYDPGLEGPIPVGYADNSNVYVFMHQQKKTLAALPANLLMQEYGLCDLAPSAFWNDFCPKLDKNGRPTGSPDVKRIGDALMQECRKAGPFNPSNVRGCGLWREGDRIIQNLRGEIPVSTDKTYIRFMSLPDFNSAVSVDPARLLDWLRLFRWEKPEQTMLLLGWLASAPLCGALDWRTHLFITGPKNSGKSTLIGGMADLLEPMAVVLDGGSTEAGVRQRIGADSRPVILDEFESDRDVGRMQRVLKLIRSASSAKAPIARGTPEGKALQFQLHSAFCLGAINPMRGTAADASRIVNLGLTRHDSDRTVKARIEEGLGYIHTARTAWPHQMIALAEEMLANIRMFESAMPSSDSRHEKNMGNLLGAAFTALYGRLATATEAEKMVSEHESLIAVLGQAHEEDDSLDCLNHLLNFVYENKTLGNVLNAARAQPEGKGSGDPSYPELGLHGIRALPEGFLVANRHVGLDRVFRETLWAGGAWVTALQRLPGAMNDNSTRSRFSGGPVVRCTLIPYSCLGPITPEKEWPIGI